MRTTGALASALAVLALALPLAGCPSMDGGGTASRQLSSAQFDDVPVPKGFVIDLAEGRSYSYSEGGGGPASIRMGRLEYTGLGDAEEILQWYAAEMPRPIHGWAPGGAAEGVPSMLFRRGSERCLVTVKPEGAAVRIVVERNTGGAEPQ